MTSLATKSPLSNLWRASGAAQKSLLILLIFHHISLGHLFQVSPFLKLAPMPALWSGSSFLEASVEWLTSSPMESPPDPSYQVHAASPEFVGILLPFTPTQKHPVGVWAQISDIQNRLSVFFPPRLSLFPSARTNVLCSSDSVWCLPSPLNSLPWSILSISDSDLSYFLVLIVCATPIRAASAAYYICVTLTSFSDYTPR